MLLRLALTLFLALFALVPAASAEKRVALVVGNAAYQNAGQLPNTLNDAQAIAGLFKSAGFDVVSARTNLGNLEFKRALREFTFAATNADIAVVFFAGHGIEVKGINYLLPVDAKLAADYDVEDEAVSLNRVIDATESAKRLRLIILDACRDNPFLKTMQRSTASRSLTTGLAKVEPTSTDTIIAYAAKAGSTADDGRGANSPFTTALLKHLSVPGRDIRIAFGHVRDEVLANTGRKQEPFVYGSLGGASVELFPAAAPAPAPAPVIAAPPAAPAADRDAAIRRDYELAERVGTKEGWESFLSSYSTGFYANLAQAQRNKLIAEENRVAATEKAKAAADERARLAADGARAAEQAKAQAQARAAEQARIAAERAKKAEEDKLAQIERAKPPVGRAMTTTPRDAAVGGKAEEGSATAATTATDRPIGPVAALPAPAAVETAKPAVDMGETSRLLQSELVRVGCHTGPVVENWNTNARRSLERFNQRSGQKLDTQLASVEALDAVRSATASVCPVQCGAREIERNGSCVAKTCAPGLALDADGDCVKPKSRTAVAAPPQKPLPEKKAAQKAAPAAAASGGSCAGGHQACMNRLLSVGWKAWEAAGICRRSC